MGARKKSKDLTDLQRIAADEYLIDADQTASYLRALKRLGRKPTKAARSNASEIFQVPAVRAYVVAKQDARAQRVALQQDDILHDLKELRDVDLVQLLVIDKDGIRPKDLQLLTPAQRRAIKSISVTYDPKGKPQYKIELHDRLRILELAGRHLGTWTADDEQMPSSTVNNNYVVVLPDKVKDAEAWVKEYAVRPAAALPAPAKVK